VTPDYSGSAKDSFSRCVRGGFSVVEFNRGPLREFYINFLPETSGEAESIEETYDRVAELLSQLRAELVNERCYADVDQYDQIRKVRALVYDRYGLEHAGGWSFVGARSSGAPIDGVQVWAVTAQDSPAVKTMHVGAQAVGRKFSHAGVSYGCFAAVHAPSECRFDSGLKQQAVSMFREAADYVGAYGFRYRDVVRTWIYLPNLLDWYDDFNAARRQVYTELGLCGGTEPLWFPASTGIQGRSPLGGECMMDLLAVCGKEGSGLERRMLGSPLQCEAYDYGSSFCRAVEVRDESVSRIFVSGTASIDEEGKTVFQDDPVGQIDFTLRVVEQLIGSRGHSLGDVAQCVAFLKNPEYAELFQSIAASRGLDSRVTVRTVADVCRADLLFELEALTIKPVTRN
jgi:enamine deaminase RidA (YjgF/YER057c/UK114 family)